MLNLLHFIKEAYQTLPSLQKLGAPWQIPPEIPSLVQQLLNTLSDEYSIQENVAIHRSAIIERGVILKGPIVISAECFVAAHAYLRGGVFLANNVTVGPGCEVKSSLIFSRSALAHFNFVGDSLVGSDVNLEAGSILANHFNERTDKTIFVRVGDQTLRTETQKFGALIGDNSRLGANSVTQPGTILPPDSVVKRLQLVDQISSSQ